MPSVSAGTRGADPMRFSFRWAESASRHFVLTLNADGQRGSGSPGLTITPAPHDVADDRSVTPSKYRIRFRFQHTMPRRKFALGRPPRRPVARASPEGSQGHHRRHVARGTCRAQPPRGAGQARHPGEAPCLDLERVVQPGKHAWYRDPLLSRSSAPDAARAEEDLDVEGGTGSECMRILRHEAGHVMQHSYQLNRRRRWQKLFGRSSNRYPNPSRPNPAAKASSSICGCGTRKAIPMKIRRNVRGVAAAPVELAKALCRLAGAEEAGIRRRADDEIAGQTRCSSAGSRSIPSSASPRRSASTTEKAGALRRRSPTTYDRDLQRLFSGDPQHRHSQPASTFLANRAKIRQLVSKWTGEYQLTLDAVLDDMITRCRELNLRAVGPKPTLSWSSPYVDREDDAFAVSPSRRMVRAMKELACSCSWTRNWCLQIDARDTPSSRSTSGRPSTMSSARCVPAARGPAARRPG